MTRSVRLAAYSVDPPALDPFHSFDPESFVAISMIADSLVHFDANGDPQPSLATRWERTGPMTMEFELRQGVQFHDGSPFDADSVVATFETHLDPERPSIGGKGLLSAIKSVTKLGDFRVRFETHFPDALLLRRFFFSQIYPAHILRTKGRAAIFAHPVGTGAFELVHWQKGREIRLRKNPQHWAQRDTVDEIVIPILKQKEWVDALTRGEIDVAINVDAHDAARLSGREGVSVAHASAAISHFFLLASKGPLADVRVRRALNHAVHRQLLVDVSEHGHAKVQCGLATAEAEGFDPSILPYRYAPETAKRLLAEAGHERMELRGLVSETSIGVYLAVREFLARVGVTLTAEIVPRGELLQRVVVDRMMGATIDDDFILTNCDNPVLHSLFHQYIFFFSQGPFSLNRSPAYDQAFLAAATEIDPEKSLAAAQKLERFAHDEALALFTVQQHVFTACRPGFSLPLFKSGHFDNSAFWELAAPSSSKPSVELVFPHAKSTDIAHLIEATSHPGMFFMRPGVELQDPALDKLWRNLSISQERWLVQLAPMLRELVAQVDARANLVNVLQSTERVAITGYDFDGRRLFVNAGYEALIGKQEAPLPQLFDADGGGATWLTMKAEIESRGSWLGPIDVHTSSGKRHFYLTATQASDEQGVAIGHTFVLSDFSGAEERIKSGAIRTILDNVPFGLLRVDATLCVLDGYSTSCDQFLTRRGAAILGRALPELLGLCERERDNLEMLCTQIFDDILPESVSTDQLPSRLRVGGKVLALRGSAIRDQHGAVASILFSLADVTELDAAERETEKVRGVLKVLQFKNRFGEFVTDLGQVLARLASSGQVPQEAARRELHTAKGVFAQFGLADLARLIHDLEEQASIRSEDLLEVRARLASTLRQHHAIWGLQLDGPRNHKLALESSALEELEARVARATSLGEARELVRAFREEAEHETVQELAGPLEELVSQLAQRLGKRVRFELEGGQQRVSPKLGPVFHAVTHLIRNAVDHGVEPPDERGEKPEEAVVRLSFVAASDAWVITLTDDGKGIDVERVAARALELKLLTEEALASASQAEKLSLVLRGGLSTATSVSDISGRGVGTSAVDDVVQRLGGVVNVGSQPGVGTSFELRIPRAASRTRSQLPSAAPRPSGLA